MLRADKSKEESAIGISAKRKPFELSSIVVVIRAISKSSERGQYLIFKYERLKKRTVIE
jgi:hypothetical protein